MNGLTSHAHARSTGKRRRARTRHLRAPSERPGMAPSTTQTGFIPAGGRPLQILRVPTGPMTFNRAVTLIIDDPRSLGNIWPEVDEMLKRSFYPAKAIAGTELFGAIETADREERLARIGAAVHADFGAIEPPAPGPNQYRCDICGGIFDKAWTNDDAEAELRRNFPGLKPGDCGITCDNCFDAIMGSPDD